MIVHEGMEKDHRMLRVWHPALLARASRFFNCDLSVFFIFFCWDGLALESLHRVTEFFFFTLFFSFSFFLIPG